jgi:hypothetical protein
MEDGNGVPQPAPEPESPPQEMGPTLSKELYEARRSEGIRSVFRLAGLILLRASGVEQQADAQTPLTTALRLASEFIPRYQSGFKNRN